jgi:hypothetical protein
MSAQEILILAMTHMLSGVCTAGFTQQPHPRSHYAWVRPVKEHGSLLLGDLTDAEGRVLQCGDVVALHLLRHRPNPPHAEDWTCEFIFQRPRLLRRLEGERRARFLTRHLDQAPREVLGPEPSRSLCLVRPDRIWANFALDPYSHKYQARIGFTVERLPHHQGNSPRGIPVTDIKWRALGRSWIGDGGGELALDDTALKKRLEVDEVFLALGLSRSYEGTIWPLVIGVHPVPDYQVEIDYRDL